MIIAFFFCPHLSLSFTLIMYSGDPPFLVLRTFYMQRVIMASHQAHAISILKCAFVVGEGSSRLGILLGGLPPFLI